MNVLKKLFLRPARLSSSPPIEFTAQPMPENDLFVVGDIHGRADLLSKLLNMVNLPESLNNGTEQKLVFVGDYVDRGENSLEALSMVFGLCESHPESVIALQGNHEKMLLEFLDQPKGKGRRWLRNGGLQTLASFGVGNITETSNEADLQKARDRFKNTLSEGMEKWLRAMPLTYNSGNIWVVHAAADPNVPFEDQSDRVLLWGLSDFHRAPRSDGNWVVHGHTIIDTAKVEAGRISIDTGAYFSNRLTLAHIENGKIEFTHT